MDLLPEILEKSKPITTVTELDFKTFKKEYFNKKRPVLIKGFAKKWPAFQKWNFDFFANLEIQDQIEMEIGNVLNKETQLEEKDVKKYLEKVRDKGMEESEDKTYLTAYQIFADFPELLGALEEHQYRGYFTIERENASNPVYEIGEAVKFLRAV